jgi:hypothetical protein
LDGAKKKLKENKDDNLNEDEMLQSLKKIRSFLIDLKSEI